MQERVEIATTGIVVTLVQVHVYHGAAVCRCLGTLLVEEGMEHGTMSPASVIDRGLPSNPCGHARESYGSYGVTAGFTYIPWRPVLGVAITFQSRHG